MKIRLLIVMISMFGAIALPAATPDILVTQEGESLKVERPEHAGTAWES